MDYIKATRENLEQEHICCAISNNKDVQVLSKKTWLSERFVEGLVFLKSVDYKGFSVCDESDNGIQLWYLPFVKDAEKPQFKECARHPRIAESVYVLYYTNQCPFNAKYLPILEKTAVHGCIITVNAFNYCVITAHKDKRKS